MSGATSVAATNTSQVQAEQEQDSRRWMKRFFNGEHDRFYAVKKFLNVQEDHIVVKVLLDFFQSHGGFDALRPGSGTDPSAVASCRPVKDETPPHVADLPRHNGPGELAAPCPDDRTDPSAVVSCHLVKDELLTPGAELRRHNGAGPLTPGVAAAENGGGAQRSLRGSRKRPPRQNGAGTTLRKTRVHPSVAVAGRSPVLLPAVDPLLMPFFACGLCGATDFADLAAHFAHLWAQHTELRMLGSAQRRRVPLKLRPHMFVTCALCGLNNRSTATAGVSDRHLTRAHMPARHRCGLEGEGRANARYHRLWHRVRLPFQCYLCAERFATEPACVAHVRAEHEAAFNVHRCARCPYATSLVSQFIQHARTHVGLNACVCHQCGVMFQTGQSLRRHLETHSGTEFRCPHCAKAFRHPLPLERHVKSQHISPDDHKCAACGKLFSTRYHLERHAMIHSGRRPHQCELCGRAFVQKGDLARHLTVGIGHN
ncbi:zinc finger protein 135-like [Pollicipes pollicipes]|uniref:zinc finger protein 135-like n=1 Tax=Pollicipes pollicipes TaxID=41117 RepID=UPI001884C595|nr:zinc finger protein 135-like [Pollicipes pollicipes]